MLPHIKLSLRIAHLAVLALCRSTTDGLLVVVDLLRWFWVEPTFRGRSNRRHSQKVLAYSVLVDAALLTSGCYPLPACPPEGTTVV